MCRSARAWDTRCGEISPAPSWSPTAPATVAGTRSGLTIGDNSVSDSAEARELLSSITGDACFTGYVEVSSGLSRQLATETGRLFAELASGGCAAGSYALNDFDDVWGAVRHFFSAEAKALEPG